MAVKKILPDDDSVDSFYAHKFVFRAATVKQLRCLVIPGGDPESRVGGKNLEVNIKLYKFTKRN